MGFDEGVNYWSADPHGWIRPYCAESAASHPKSEVKLRQAVLVLGWATTRESTVPYPFCALSPLFLSILWVCLCSLSPPLALLLLHSLLIWPQVLGAICIQGGQSLFVVLELG